MTLPRALRGWPALFVVLLVLQAPLLLDPGYFSHDELQWAARADVPHWTALPWESWTDLGPFQYRPLTFNLWLLLSHAFFATPLLMHAVFVGLGSLGAVLLGRCVEGAGAPRRVAATAAVAFVLSPCVAYVHGWTGTLADLLTLLMALLGLRALQASSRSSDEPDLLAGAVAVAATGLALLCKESAVVLPAVLLLALYRSPRPRRVLGVAAACALVVALYLALRLPRVLSPPSGHESYAWAFAHVPRRLAEYLLYPFLPPLFEIGATLTKSPGRLLAAAACLAAVLGALASVGWRWACVWLASVAALLAPVLVLQASYAQYAYLASAAAVGIAAVAWPRMRAAPRIALGVAAAVAAVHGGGVMSRMYQVGVVQQRFHRDLSALVATTDAPRIALADEQDRWMFARFLNEVPFYRGARLAEAGETAPFVVRRDGHLVRRMP